MRRLSSYLLVTLLLAAGVALASCTSAPVASDAEEKEECDEDCARRWMWIHMSHDSRNGTAFEHVRGIPAGISHG